MRHDSDDVDFDEFAMSRWSMALRLAHRLTGNASTAEDLAQEALARMWSRWGRLERDHLDAYLRRTVANLFCSQARRRRRYEQIIRLVPRARPLTDGTRGVDERDELATALLQLPARQRTVVVLRYVEDLAVADVADAMGCSEGTVKTQSSRGLAALRRHLSPHEASEEKRPI